MRVNGKQFGRQLMLTAAVLLSMAGCSRLGPENPGAERELLCQSRTGCRYVTNGDQYWEEKNPEWDLYWLTLRDQRGRPEEIRFELTEDVERDVFALNEDGQIVWKRTLDRGNHSIPVTKGMERILFSVRVGEPFRPVGTGMHPRLETPFTGRRLSVLGDSVSAFAGYIPWDEYSYYSSMNFGAASMWWAVLAEHTGMELCKINAVSGSGVVVPEDAASARLLAGGSDRCKDLLSGDGEAPDEILVMLGGNDFLRQIPSDRIKREYLEMLSKIKEAYPAAGIHVCTYYQCPSLPLTRLEELNGLLRSIAEEAGVGLIDLQDCGILESEPKKYLIDEVLHPNERGQILIGICGAQQLLESEAAP